MKGMSSGARPRASQAARQASVIGRTMPAGRSATTLTSCSATHSARPACEIPNHSGGCGRWTGRSVIGTAS